MSFAGSGYIAFIKRDRIKQEKEKKKREQKNISKDQKKFLNKFGLI